MRSDETAKIISLISHPTRVDIIKLLHTEPRTYSEMLKNLALESTSKFSFHLEKLGPLVTKNEYGEYQLSQAGRHISNFIDSFEENELLSNVPNSYEIDSLQEKENSMGFWKAFITHKNFFFLYYSITAFSFLLGIIAFYFYQMVPGMTDWNPIISSFPLLLLMILFIFPIIFFIFFLLHHKERYLPFKSFFLGLIVYVILYSTTFFFLFEFNASFLDIIQPSWWVPEDPPLNSLEAIIIFIKSITFNEFPKSRLYTNNHFLIQVLWLIVYLMFALVTFYISRRIDWINWYNLIQEENGLFPKNSNLLENKFFWLFLVTICYLLSISFDILSSDVVILDMIIPSHLLILNYNGVTFPPLGQLLPILPTLLITLIIFGVNFQKVNLPVPMKPMLLLLIFGGPILLIISALIDTIYIFNFYPIYRADILIYFISKILTGVYQVITLIGYVIILQKLIHCYSDLN